MRRRANKEGTIYKKTVTRNGKEYTYWESQVTVGYDPGSGKRLRKTYTGSTQKEVKEKMQAAAVAVQNNDFFEPKKATVGQWIELWLSEYCPNIKYQTRKSYEAQCRTHILPALSNIPLASLSTEQIQSFYSDLAKTGKTVKHETENGKIEIVKEPLSPKSIKNIHAILSKSLNVAAKLKYIRYNPAALTERKKVTKPDISPLTTEELKMVLSELDNEEYGDLYKLIIFTGLRKAEALGLTWNCINLKKRTMRINKQMQKRPIRDGGYTIAPVKSDRTRTITFSPYVEQILTKVKTIQDEQKESDIWTGFLLPNGKDADLVFTKEDGTPLSPKTVWRHYNKLANKIGTDATRVHDLRHTYATIALENGDDYKTLQETLGHASASFTLDVYGHLTTKMQQESASRMQDYIASLTDTKTPQKH